MDSPSAKGFGTQKISIKEKHKELPFTSEIHRTRKGKNMIQADYHVHSSFSGDSKSPMEDIIQKAIELQLKYICFTEHYDYDFPYMKPEETGMFDLDAESYLEKNDFYKSKYRNQIEVLHGIEIGVQPHIGEYLNEYVNRYPFDFIIASSHVCDRIDPYYPVFFENRTVKDAVRSYFEGILRNIQVFEHFNIYGHLDYVLRYVPGIINEYSHKDYEDLYEEILKSLISMGKGIEINSGGMRTVLERTNPSFDVLRLYKKLGGEIITVGSDAHKPEHLAWEFKHCESILKEAGFKYYTVFQKREPTFLPL